MDRFHRPIGVNLSGDHSAAFDDNFGPHGVRQSQRDTCSLSMSLRSPVRFDGTHRRSGLDVLCANQSREALHNWTDEFLSVKAADEDNFRARDLHRVDDTHACVGGFLRRALRDVDLVSSALRSNV
jgi:hypothetical protein